MKILYRDDDVLVCEKPYGVSSQKSDGENMLDIIRDELGVEAYVIHRLDITTSGLMVYALNKESASSLSAQIANHRFTKGYLAITHTEIGSDRETLTDYLFHDKRQNKVFVVDEHKKGAKKAILSFSLMGHGRLNGYPVSVLKVRLETGRTHQIRAQLSHFGTPLVGDKKYGARDNCKRIGLYSYMIGFMHPKTDEPMLFKQLPLDDELWKGLRFTYLE
ncbi:MAG: RluA family pseudouridine synthase [Clostridia bacterium]|nr:RluA family pseudouridine synthase [Clostridia bacterium]